MRKLSLAMLVMVFAIAFFSVSTTHAASSVSVYAKQVTNVRSGPGTSYSVIGILVDGDSVTATGRNSAASWLRFDYNGSEGWVSASYVNVSGDIYSLSVVSASSSANVILGKSGVTATTNAEAFIQLGPGTSYRAVAKVSSGSSYDVTGRTTIYEPLVCRGSSIIDLSGNANYKSVWLRINVGGLSGWIAYSSVSVSGNLCSVSVASADQSTIDTVNGFTQRAIVVTQNDANLRKTVGSQGEVLTVIPAGTSLVADGRNSDRSRIHVTYQDQTGWVAASVIQVQRGTLSNLPVTE